MLKRKKKLVDKRFQLKAIFKITGISTISFLIILSFIIYKAYQSNRDITSTIDNLNSAVETENNIIRAFVKFSSEFTGQRIRLAVQNIETDHAKSITAIRQYIAFLRQFMIEYYQIIIIIIAVVVLQTVFYFFFLMRFTHRISGPIYVINRYVQDLIDGRKPVQRELRDKDEFKDLYEKLKKLSAKLERAKARQKKDK